MPRVAYFTAKRALNMLHYMETILGRHYSFTDGRHDDTKFYVAHLKIDCCHRKESLFSRS